MYKVFWLRMVVREQIFRILMKKNRAGMNLESDDFAAIESIKYGRCSKIIIFAKFNNDYEQ